MEGSTAVISSCIEQGFVESETVHDADDDYFSPEVCPENGQRMLSPTLPRSTMTI
jgi:hypothetical protein